MKTKAAILREALEEGRDIDALRIAARFPQLGEHKNAITQGWAAHTNPGFYSQLGKDPAALVIAGIVAVHARYA